MIKTKGALVKSLLGWRIADNGNHVLLGFEQANGKEVALAISTEDLMNVSTGLLDATAALSKQKGEPVQQRLTVQTNWYELGNVQGGTDVVLSFYTEGGGSITYRIPRDMAERLNESLTEGLSPGSTPQPPNKNKH